uniref:ARAD1D41184p n=1 Tax=Blastobotrys adeninivorans TaxID=409370 RepID=A0A060TCE3_BLAAD
MVRLHIGNISSSVDEKELEKRLSKYGEVIEPMEVRKKPTLDTRFAFITMDLDQQALASLKRAYHNVLYKGTKLTVNVAKPDYNEAWKEQQSRPEPGPNPEQLKRHYQLPAREFNTFLGRLREKRKDWRHVTVRMISKKSGKVIVIRCPKKKLWGLSKKPLQELVWEYSGGQWKDGLGDTIETVDYKVLIEPAADSGEELGPEARVESDRNMQILQSLFGADGENEKQLEKMDIFDSDDGIPRPAHKDYTNEDYGDYEGDEQNGYENEENYEPMDEEQQEEEEQIQVDVPVPEGLSEQSLKSVFDGGGFQFQMNDDDLDLDKDMYEDAPEIKPPEVDDTAQVLQPLEKQGRGLFFAHFDSPFLSVQTQLSKLPTGSFDKTQWEEEFWNRRGELNRLFQRRRRDVLRRKKNVKAKSAYL